MKNSKKPQSTPAARPAARKTKLPDFQPTITVTTLLAKTVTTHWNTVTLVGEHKDYWLFASSLCHYQISRAEYLRVKKILEANGEILKDRVAH